MRRFFLLLAFLSFSAWAQPPASQQAQQPIVVKVEMPPTPHRDFLGYLQSLGPLIAACVAVGVALMQRHLQRQQQTQTLFDKRFKVYESTIAYLTNILQLDGKTDIPLYQEFRTNTDPSEFMFGSDVFTFIKDVGWTGLDFRRIQMELDHHTVMTNNRVMGSDPAEDDRRLNESLAQIPVLQRQVRETEGKLGRLLGGEAKSVFLPYLKLHHDQGRLARFIARVNRWVVQEQPDTDRKSVV